MLTRKNYESLARIMGEAFYQAMNHGGEESRTLVYDSVYSPLVKYLAEDNPRFDMTRFSFAVSGYELGLKS